MCAVVAAHVVPAKPHVDHISDVVKPRSRLGSRFAVVLLGYSVWVIRVFSVLWHSVCYGTQCGY